MTTLKKPVKVLLLGNPFWLIFKQNLQAVKFR